MHVFFFETYFINKNICNFPQSPISDTCNIIIVRAIIFSVSISDLNIESDIMFFI